MVSALDITLEEILRGGSSDPSSCRSPGGDPGRSGSPGPSLHSAVFHRHGAIGSGPMRILLLEDSDPDAELFGDMLFESWPDGLELERARRLGSVPALLQGAPPDCILSDLSLPDASGLEAVDQIRALAPETPLIVLTGLDDETAAMQAVHEGAQDYLLKSHVNGFLLRRAIQYAIERHCVEREMQRQALHDPLTGLPNRRLFMETLEQALARARRTGDRLAVCFIDLDGFKTINDSLGHTAGDQVLVEVAERLVRSVRPYDSVARFGGDEFLLLCDGSDIEDVRSIVARVGEAVSLSLSSGGRELQITPSVGIAISSGDSSTETLLRDADVAMYAAKRRPGFSFQIFDSELRGHAVRALDLQHELPHAHARGQLSLHYQPQVELASGRIVGVEALMRWTHPVLGDIPPADFIPVAERLGLIDQIGMWAIEHACGQLAAWRRAGGAEIRMSVNVSAHQLRDPRFASRVVALVRKAALRRGTLTLELTETAALDGHAAIARNLDGVRAAGVRVSLDDFGTGYAGLRALAELPVDEVKIDRSFVSRVADGTANARIIDGVVGLARSMGITLIAEGIETEDQCERVRSLGCDTGQGFLLGRPVAA